MGKKTPVGNTVIVGRVSNSSSQQVDGVGEKKMTASQEIIATQESQAAERWQLQGRLSHALDRIQSNPIRKEVSGGEISGADYEPTFMEKLQSHVNTQAHQNNELRALVETLEQIF